MAFQISWIFVLIAVQMEEAVVAMLIQILERNVAMPETMLPIVSDIA